MKSGQQHCRPRSRRVHEQSMPLLSVEAAVGVQVVFACRVNKMCLGALMKIILYDFLSVVEADTKSESVSFTI